MISREFMKYFNQTQIDNMLVGILHMKVDLVCIDMFVDG